MGVPINIYKLPADLRKKIAAQAGITLPAVGKFGAEKCSGLESKLEAAVFGILKLRERAKEIRNIRIKRGVLLAVETVKNQRTGKERKRDVRWKVDFSFERVSDGVRVWCEAKGVESDLYHRQLRLWRDGAGPGPLEIWKGSWQRPILVELVIPKKGGVR